jgi:hypothetical protein
MSRLRGMGALVAVAAAVLCLTSCASSSSDHTADPTGVASAGLVAPAKATPTVTPSTTEAPTTSSAPSKPASKSAKPKPTAAAECTSKQLKIDALRGSAAAGVEFAVVTFTNTGAAACTMTGFPGVSLRLNNALVGKPAERSRKAPVPVVLKPGAQANSELTDLSSCQAPVSDTVRVYAPDQRAFVDLPLGLRACRVIVDPVTLD